MTSSNHDHATIIAGVAKHLQPVLDGSPQGIYIYLDDSHKLCNKRFAMMLGYDSPESWDMPGPFTEQYVDPKSWQTLVSTYRRAMERQTAATISVNWKTVDGRSVPSDVILVPLAYDGELIALHFVTARE